MRIIAAFTHMCTCIHAASSCPVPIPPPPADPKMILDSREKIYSYKNVFNFVLNAGRVDMQWSDGWQRIPVQWMVLCMKKLADADILKS